MAVEALVKAAAVLMLLMWAGMIFVLVVIVARAVMEKLAKLR